jgi:threonine/homoserine/homoserine lactone efflux protein
MPYEILTALVLFAFVSTITPGPNNLMLMASGANYGFGRTVPHMLGVLIGFMLMCLLVGVGLTRVFDAFPVIYRVLKLVSVLYLLYLAWRIATAAGPGDEGAASGSPLTFFQAALFQWVNPKAWAVALTAVTVYSPAQNVQATLVVAAVFGIVTGPSITVWTLAGQQLRRLLTSTLRLRLFNGLMALLLVASLYPVLSPLFQSGWVVAIGAE